MIPYVIQASLYWGKNWIWSYRYIGVVNLLGFTLQYHQLDLSNDLIIHPAAGPFSSNLKPAISFGNWDSTSEVASLCCLVWLSWAFSHGCVHGSQHHDRYWRLRVTSPPWHWWWMCPWLCPQILILSSYIYQFITGYQKISLKSFWINFTYESCQLFWKVKKRRPFSCEAWMEWPQMTVYDHVCTTY